MEQEINWRTLGDLIDSGVIVVTTGFPFGGHNDGGMGVAHIRPFNVGTDGDIHLDQIKSIPESISAGKPRLRRDDIVFNNTNTKELVGKCAIWSSEDEPVFSNHMTRIRVIDDSCDPVYLNFAILHHWITGKSEMLARAHVAQASLIGARFREIEVPWRPLREQRAASRLLNHVRLASRFEVKQLEHARNVKSVAMRELFTRGLRGEPQKESEIGPVPESWLVDPIGAHHSAVSGGTPSRSNPVFWTRGTIPWVKTTEVDYRIIRETEEHITQAGLDGSAAKLLPAGTLLLAMYGQGVTRGKVAILGIEAACNQACAAIRPTDDNVDTKYLYHFLAFRYEIIRQLAHGGQQQNLNLDIVRELRIAFSPSIDEQREIVAVLDAIDRKIELHRQKRAVLEELFKVLLHKLMKGEVRVGDLDLAALDGGAPAATEQNGMGHHAGSSGQEPRADEVPAT